jgi:hypothetical protein
MTEACPINLQWKGTDACYDFYCPCGGTSAATDPDSIDRPLVEEGHGHEDGFFKQEFQCAACGEWWHLPNRLYAMPGKFFRDNNEYGCESCESGHQPVRSTA